MRIKLTRRWSLVIAGLLGGALMAGGQFLYTSIRSGAQTSDTLAVVDGKPISVGTFQSEMGRRGGEAAFSAPEQRRALLDEMIRVAVLAANAQKAGYSDDPEIKRGVLELMAQKYERDNIDVPLAEMRVSDTDIENYYRSHTASFTTPESVHAAVIFVAIPAKATEEERQVLQQRARHIHDLAAGKSGGPTFAELANEYSDDQLTRPEGGDIGWLEVGQENSHLDSALTAAIFNLTNSGDVTAPITTGNGIYIAKLLERRAPVVQSAGEAKNTIRQQLIRAERQKLAAKFYSDALAKVHVTVNEPGVAAMEAAEKAVVDRPHDSPPQPKG